ncbi:MAG TPA: hypothetical protein VFW23_01235 [Tepidisphaeraceae bacterium]|nr:hypothetical protein [Tepidisphaeraceae bacterium]
MNQNKQQGFKSAAGLIMILAATIANGCRHAPAQPRPQTREFLALGDSYTCGESIEPTQSWPVQLAQRMGRDGIDVGQPTIIAKTGWTTNELSAGIDTRLTSRSLLWIGLALWAVSWAVIGLEIFRWHHMTPGFHLNPPPVPPGFPAPKPGEFLKGAIFLSIASPILTVMLLAWMWRSHRQRSRSPLD